MTGSIAIDVAIGLVFIYLLYSLLATVIGEIVASVFALRARNLQDAIGKMLNDDKKETSKFKAYFKSIWLSVSKIFYNKHEGLVEKFYEEPSIKYLAKNSRIKKPSYISPATFAQTLINMMEDKGEGTTPVDKIKAVLLGNAHETKSEKYDAINQYIAEQSKKGFDTLKLEELQNVANGKADDPPFICGETKKHLSNLLKNSNDDLVKFKVQLENWYDETMQRATGWYKRKSQFILFVIGLVIAISFNVNTLYIAKTMSKDDVAREQLVQMAVNYQKEHPDGIPNDTDKKTLKQLLEVKDSIEKDIQIANSIVSLGWTKNDAIDKAYYRPFYCFLCEKDAMMNMLGWLITALAISLGATFWFDLLNKLVNLRTSLAASKNQESRKDSEEDIKG